MRRVSPEARFWQRVRKTETCWLWTGGSSGGRYGILRCNGPRVAAHRFSWELANGPIPAGMLVCHHCDVPFCVRPDHLFLGTNTDNLRDMWAKGRHPGTQGERHGRHRLTEETVREARSAASDTPIAALARRYGVTRSVMGKAIHGLTWKHVA